MRGDHALDAVVEHFTLDTGALALMRNNTGVTGLGFTAMLKFRLFMGRFPRSRFELPDNVVDHLARQAQVPAGGIGFYDFTSRMVQDPPQGVPARPPAFGSAPSPTRKPSLPGLPHRKNAAPSRYAPNCWTTAAQSASSRRRRSALPGTSTPASARPTNASSPPWSAFERTLPSPSTDPALTLGRRRGPRRVCRTGGFRAGRRCVVRGQGQPPKRQSGHHGR